MPGLVPGIHVLSTGGAAGTGPAMTRGEACALAEDAECRDENSGKSWGTGSRSLESRGHPRHLARPWRLWSYRLDDPAFRGLRCRGALSSARLFPSLGIGRV